MFSTGGPIFGLAKWDKWGLGAVMICCSKLSFCQSDPQGPKDPFLPTLADIQIYNEIKIESGVVK
jgi:hypothetical protein